MTLNQKLSNWLNQNLFAKVASILLAALFFFAYRYTTLDSTSFQLPIQISIPPNSAIYWQDISTAKVTLRGSKDELEQLDRRNLVLEVGINHLDFERTSHRIELKKSINPQQFSHYSISIHPPVIELQLEPIITKQVAVEPVLLGQVARGYSHSSTQITPQTVEVNGPQSQLSSLLNIRTMPVDISNLDQSYEQKVVLNYQNPKVQVTPDTVNLKIEVISHYLYKSTIELPVTIVNLSPNFYIENLDELTGSIIIESQVNNIDKIDLSAALMLLNVSEITTAGDYSLKPQLRNLSQIPDDYNIIIQNITIHVRESINERLTKN